MAEEFTEIITLRYADLVNNIEPDVTFWAKLREHRVTTKQKEDEFKVSFCLKQSGYSKIQAIFWKHMKNKIM